MADECPSQITIEAEALFLKRVIKNVRSHDFYSPFYSFLASRYLFRVTICKNYGSFFLGFTFWVLRFLPF